MSVIEQLNWRYATKKFDSRRLLSDKQIDTLKQAFNLTALSYGLQTLKLIVVKNKELRKGLVEVSYGQKQVVDASHLLVLCIKENIGQDEVEDHFNTIKSIRRK